MALKCDICNKTFSNRSSLGRHQREIHKIDEFRGYSYNNFANKCLEGCKVSFKFVDDLRSHLKIKHNFEMVCTELEYTSEDEFQSFRNNLVCTEKAQYVLSSSKRINLGNQYYEKRYYACNRSARTAARPRDSGEGSSTSNKTQGTYIMDTTCTSQLIVLKCIQTDFLNVTFFKTHYGHDLQLEHLYLTKEEKKNIALKLAKGASVAKILDSYRSNIEIDKAERFNLITPRDVHQIKHAFKVKVPDLYNVLNEDKNENKNENNADIDVDQDVIFYKKQNTEHLQLKYEDICIILMNKSQQVMLTQFGSSIIALDRSNYFYDTCLEVTTLAIVDEFTEGFPVAYMFSNRKDDTIMEIFFDVLKNKVGTIDCKNFITDEYNTTTYKGWIKIMTTLTTKHLFSTWFVQRDWQENLKKLHNIKKKDIYERLKALQQTLDPAKFDENLAKELQSLQMNDTIEFANYFIDHYSQSTEKWAYCFQESSVISNNLALHSDRIRKVLKNTYLEDGNTICLDKAMHAVMRLARDKTAERLIKLHKGITWKYRQITNQRHKIALSAFYTVGVDDTFLILTSDNTEYHIKIVNNHTCCNKKCSECNVCIQCFICSCSDYLNKHIICEHVHYIKMNVIFEDEHVEISSQQQVQNLATGDQDVSE